MGKTAAQTNAINSKIVIATQNCKRLDMGKNIYKKVIEGVKKARKLKRAARRSKDLRRRLKSMQGYHELIDSLTPR
tara:strand:+ start:927 stop:1154 length:228 start_codon:yes stop_codon:yes gene_type:complete